MCLGKAWMNRLVQQGNKGIQRIPLMSLFILCLMPSLLSCFYMLGLNVWWSYWVGWAIVKWAIRYWWTQWIGLLLVQQNTLASLTLLLAWNGFHIVDGPIELGCCVFGRTHWSYGVPFNMKWALCSHWTQ